MKPTSAQQNNARQIETHLIKAVPVSHSETSSVTQNMTRRDDDRLR